MPPEAAKRDARQRRGAAAELAARAHLEARGLVTVCANFRTRAGELDLVMRDGPAVVVVEVRCRSSARFGGALGSVAWRKQQRMIAAASLLLRARPQLARLPMRFDVVAVTPIADAGFECAWEKDAFRA